MNIYPFIHPVAIALRIVASAGFDNFYDIYGVYSDSIIDSAFGYSIFMANPSEEIFFQCISAT